MTVGRTAVTERLPVDAEELRAMLVFVAMLAEPKRG
jgi:hypothetical protein